MSRAQTKLSPANAVRTTTLWVVNSDAQVREVVESAIQNYPLGLNLLLNFWEDLRPVVDVTPPDVVLINLTAQTESILSLLPSIRQQWPHTHVIFLSESNDIHLWADAIQLGAYEFLPKCVESQQLGWVLQDAFWTSHGKVLKPAAT
jgi:DNA-binding NtrC family response regulator